MCCVTHCQKNCIAWLSVLVRCTHQAWKIVPGVDEPLLSPDAVVAVLRDIRRFYPECPCVKLKTIQQLFENISFKNSGKMVKFDAIVFYKASTLAAFVHAVWPGACFFRDWESASARRTSESASARCLQSAAGIVFSVLTPPPQASACRTPRNQLELVDWFRIQLKPYTVLI